MVEFLLGLALVVAIITTIVHFWTIWRPILKWCGIGLGSALFLGAGVASVILVEEWTDDMLRSDLPRVQAAAVLTPAIAAAALVAALMFNIAKALVRHLDPPKVIPDAFEFLAQLANFGGWALAVFAGIQSSLTMRSAPGLADRHCSSSVRAGSLLPFSARTGLLNLGPS